MQSPLPFFTLSSALLALAIAPAFAEVGSCSAQSGASITPVIELYTSESCSSCPPADQWLSTLKGQPVVVQAFHVDYWNHIGWVDRFSNPAFSKRQRELATLQRLAYVYTPQIKRDGLDWRGWRGQSRLASGGAAKMGISMTRAAGSQRYEARVQPSQPGVAWSGYWTVTENGHSSRVRSGENAGEFLQHDFVVRQYQPFDRMTGAQTMSLDAAAGEAGHTRQVNLVVTDPASGAVLQALALQCDAGNIPATSPPRGGGAPV